METMHQGGKMIDLFNPAHLLLVSLAALLFMFAGAKMEDDTAVELQFLGLCIFTIMGLTACWSMGHLIFLNV